ncbi:MAG: tetratricopeptide repeat protein [Armatimonadota bacterium]
MNARRNPLVPLMLTIGLATLTTSALALPIADRTPQPPGAAHVKDPAVDAISKGRVSGGVHDAATGQPIAGATISIRSNGQFPTEGKSVATTDGGGRYECAAELGRSRSKTDRVKEFVGFLGGGTLPGTQLTSHHIEVDQLTVQITAPGYKTFVGILPVRSYRALDYSVRMSPVLLAPARQPGESFAAPRWGATKILSLRLDPPIAAPGQSVSAEFRAELPAPGDRSDGKPYAIKGHVRLDSETWVELKDHQIEGNVHTFRGTFKAPKLDRTTVASFRDIDPVIESPYELLPTQFEKSALLQVVASEAGRRQAEERYSAYDRYTKGDYSGAADAFGAIARTATASAYDQRMAAMMQTLLGRHDAASEYLRTAYAMEHSGTTATSYARALLAGNRAETVVAECGQLLADYRAKHKESDVPKAFAPPLLATIGRAHLRLGAVAKARELADMIARQWPVLEQDRIFETEVRRAEVESVLAATPKDPAALARRAQILRDQGEWQEADQAVRAALAEMPGNSAMIRDLAYIRLHLKGSAGMEPVPDVAITSAETLASATEGNKEVLASDFPAWHILGTLRAAKALQDLPSSPKQSMELLDRAHEAFDQALLRGQAPIPKIPRNVATSIVGTFGFAEKGAGPDFDLRQAVLVLRENPVDALAWTELGRAFLDSDLPQLAERAANRAGELGPASVGLVHLKAMIAEASGRAQEAAEGYRAVLARVPNHPSALLQLAKLMDGAGDRATAQELRERHAKFHTVP